MNTELIRAYGRKSVANSFDCGECCVTSFVIRIEDGLDIFCRMIHMVFHDGFDDLRNLSESNSFVQKGTDGLLIRGVHRGRQRAAFGQGAIREPDARKTVEIGRFEVQT